MNLFIRNILAVAVSIGFITVQSQAELITFEFGTGGQQAGLDLDGLETGSSVITGSTFTVTLQANTTVSGDEFNSVVGNFGINSANTGDDTDAFDGADSSEAMNFSFTLNVGGTINFVNADFDRITGAGSGGEDIGFLNFTGGSSFVLSGSTVDGSDNFTANEAITSGQNISLGWTDGNGFGLESITLDVVAVPEPSAGILALLGGALLWSRRKRA